jgi:hypothetical protein
MKHTLAEFSGFAARKPQGKLGEGGEELPQRLALSFVAQ